VNERRYLSIGEVLGLLLEEFPDVTISKIRYLEGEGLIKPERTPSGYRKFYETDVDLLRLILREQKEHFLPLRVIRDRIETGEITAELARPTDAGHADPGGSTGAVHQPSAAASSAAGFTTVAGEPGPPPAGQPAPAPWSVSGSVSEPAPAPEPEGPGEPTEYTAAELAARCAISAELVGELESYGLLESRTVGSSRFYPAESLAIAHLAAAFHRHGIEARHLRAFRTAVDRELGVIEQLVTPLLRQRNPQARAAAAALARELGELGGALRGALVHRGLQQYTG
jgi:DNA-binding transcriptional MerR regulator